MIDVQRGTYMQQANYYQWKQLVEGIARGLVGPFEWKNAIAGTDMMRHYLDSHGNIVATMCVTGANSDKRGCDCERTFEIRQELLDNTWWIYIPTDKEYEAWSEEESWGEGGDITSRMIAQYETEAKSRGSQ